MSLLRIGRKGEVINGSTRCRRRAPRAAAVDTARLRRWMDEPLPNELPLLGEHLHPIAAALADIHQAVTREMNAVNCRRKLHPVRGWSGDVVIRCGGVVDVSQRNPLAAPPAFERAGVHVIDQDSLVQEAVGNEDLAGVLIQLKGTDAWGEG